MKEKLAIWRMAYQDMHGIQMQMALSRTISGGSIKGG
jgi:hypothetical protein